MGDKGRRSVQKPKGMKRKNVAFVFVGKWIQIALYETDEAVFEFFEDANHGPAFVSNGFK